MHRETKHSAACERSGHTGDSAKLCRLKEAVLTKLMNTSLDTNPVGTLPPPPALYTLPRIKETPSSGQLPEGRRALPSPASSVEVALNQTQVDADTSLQLQTKDLHTLL